MQFGVSRQDVVNVIVSLERQKINFNNAGSIDGKKQVVLDAKKDWSEFISKAVPQMKKFFEEKGEWK
jgi:hypothetical protein